MQLKHPEHDHVKREPGGPSPDERKLQNNFRTGAVEAAEREWYRPARRPTDRIIRRSGGTMMSIRSLSPLILGACPWVSWTSGANPPRGTKASCWTRSG